MSERKITSRNVAIGLGIICIILIAYTRAVNATIENEYTATYHFGNYPFDLNFAITVKVTIETEADNA